MHPAHSPALIASTVKVRDVKISPDGKHIMYQVQAFYKPVDRFIAELWVAQSNVAYSARQLTDGQYYDKLGVFHPTKPGVVVFLSDRWNPGKGANLYMLDIRDENPEPVLLTKEVIKKGVLQFQISPDGGYLAYASPIAGAESNDVRIYGSHTNSLGLFMFHFDTGEISSTTIRSDRHIESFTWSPDSTHLLYRLRKGRSAEAAEEEVLLERIAIDNASLPVQVGLYARSPAGPNIWLRSGHVVSLQSFEEENILDSRTLYVHREEGAWTRKSWVRKLYGETDDAVRIVDMSYGDDDMDTGMIAVEVCSDTDTRIDGVVFRSPRNGDEDDVLEVIPLFQTQNEAVWFGAWDARRVHTEDGGVVYVCSAVLSSGIRHESPNVWSVTVPARGDAKVNGNGVVHKASAKICLSRHLQWLVDAPHIPTEVFHWKAKDGTDLSGLIRYPPGYNNSTTEKLPTVMFLHGGPYRRDVPDYMPYFCNWREMLASAGYVVVSPNYRGSQGRGHDFAQSANLGIGTLDWSDCASMVDAVIARGITDPSRLGIAGWSHGGSMAAWGITETKNRFSAAIIGAGVSNWESMVMEASSPELEAAIGGVKPWLARKDSPVHKVKGVTTAVLILHGEKDERVPLAQGLGLYRGLKKNDGNVEMVIYPREPHGFVERRHAEDVMNRVLEHFSKWL
ncbi:alpha/beta-hydrolase [Hymenopellis radicata]|nr:alpha/beta-hydrolase [Hymenopellis radicata]